MPGDEQVDVVVAGSGAAGLTAALVAAAAGLSVVVLEKSGLVGGTTAVSGGGFWIPCNHHMAEVGVPDSRDDALAYVHACAEGELDPGIAEAIVDDGARMVRHLEHDLGLTPFRAWPPVGTSVDYRPWLPGARHGGRTLEAARFAVAELGPWIDRVRTGPQSRAVGDRLNYFRRHVHAAPPAASRTSGDPDPPRRRSEPGYQGGTALVAQLLMAGLRYGVDVRTGQAVCQLSTESSHVCGVIARAGRSTRTLRARLGVVLATGGYGANPQLRKLWLRRPVAETCEVDENVGDGHLMGAAAGAQLANLGDAWWMPRTPLGADGEGNLNIGGTREDRSLPHTLIVNATGRRFVNESLNYYDFCAAFGAMHKPRNTPAWLVFDHAGTERYAALAAKVPSDPSTAPWLRTAATLDELAEQIGIDASAFAATVRRFNGFATTGRDLDFGRGESAWDVSFGDPEHGPNPALGTVERPPFHAVEVLPGALATKGGLLVNRRGEVLAATTGEPIPGLFAAGNVSSGAVPNAYVGAGATIGPAMTFGYLAARRIVESAARAL